MPLVRCWYNPVTFRNPSELSTVCSEIVPVALNSPQGDLTPGSIECFVAARSHNDQMSVDAFVDIESMYYEDRAANLQDRGDLIKDTLQYIFTGKQFAVWLKVVNAAWCSDKPDPAFDGEMTIKAAIARLREYFPIPLER